MDEKPDVIRHEIEETRQSLTEKLETLEGQVKDTIGSVTESVEQTVERVKETVTDTVENVKETVSDTVENVKRTFDLSYQVDRHPWAMAGVSLAAGMTLGYLTGGRRGHAGRGGWGRERAPSRSAFGDGSGAGYQPSTAGYQAAASGGSDYRREHEGPGMLSRLLASFAPEIDKIKGTAVAAVMGMLRDSLLRSVPPALAEHVQEIMDDLTRKAGGQPIREPILPATGCAPETGFGRTGSTPTP